MPGLEEVEGYLTGVVLLVRNRKDGFDWLDISADGFWRSFWAIAYALPALALTWASYRLAYLEAGDEGLSAGPGFIARVALIDVVTWIAPLVLLALAARPLGVARQFARFVVATNWLSMATAYALALPALLSLMTARANLLVLLVSIVFFVLAIAVLYRVSRLVFDGEAGMAAFVTAATVVLSMMLTGLLQQMLGVAIR